MSPSSKLNQKERQTDNWFIKHFKYAGLIKDKLVKSLAALLCAERSVFLGRQGGYTKFQPTNPELLSSKAIGSLSGLICMLSLHLFAKFE